MALIKRPYENEADARGLVLLAQPYVSDLLQEAIIAMDLAVYEVEPLSLNANVRQQLVDSATAHTLINTRQARIYLNSENALSFYVQALQDDNRKQAIAAFKDKRQFRELLAEVYPKLAYCEVHLSELSSVDSDSLRFPLVLKPSIGFFSAGVYIVHTQAAWADAVEQLTAELNSKDSHYPESVLNREKILIEDYIDGPEFAIDAFFDIEGDPVLVNAMYHVFPREGDTRDILYLTNREIVESLRSEVIDLLHRLGQKLDLKNFPLHLEVRRDASSGRLIPIEVNPCRFAGWCTTDLATFAYGINVYESYFQGVAPNWDLTSSTFSTSAFVILHPPIGTRLPDRWVVDRPALERLLGNVLELRLVDHARWGIFGIAFVGYDTQEQAEQAVHLDLRPLLPDGATPLSAL